MNEAAATPSLQAAPRGRADRPEFTEKTFYLEEFYGRSLLFALIPPCGERRSELDSLVRTLRELRRNQTRCVVVVARAALERLFARMGRRAPSSPALLFNPAEGRRSRPYPPDSAVAALYQALRTGSMAVAAADTADPIDFIVFAQELASRLRALKFILLDRNGGLAGDEGARLSFLEMRRIARVLGRERSPVRRAILRAARRALEDGVGSVNLSAPRGVYEELLSFIGTGTLFTERPYGSVRPVAIDDFEEVEALIRRGQREGVLLERSPEEIAAILPSCFGYRVGDEHLAGICSLLAEPYRRERVGEITALYTLTRFQGEGVAAELVGAVIEEARSRRLSAVFACTSEERAARFFARFKAARFRRVGPDQVPAAKWRGYDRARIARLAIFRADLGGRRAGQ